MKETECSVLVNQLIFGNGELELSRLREHTVRIPAILPATRDLPLLPARTLEDVFRRFYYDVINVGVLERPISEDEVLQKIRTADSRSLPLIDVLLKDIVNNPNRFESWCYLVKELTDLYLSLQDIIGEVCVPMQLPEILHEYDGCTPLEHCLHPLRSSYESPDLIPLLCIRKNLLFEVIFRVTKCTRELYSLCPTSDPEESAELINGLYESNANLLYNTSLQFPKKSDTRISCVKQSLEYFIETADIRKVTQEAAYSFMMAGKLTWQLHKDLNRSMDYFNLAMNEENSFFQNKVLKIGLFYQVSAENASSM